MHKQPHDPCNKPFKENFWQINYGFKFRNDSHGALIIINKWFHWFSMEYVPEVYGKVFTLLNGYLCQLRVSVWKSRIRCLQTDITYRINIFGLLYFIKFIDHHSSSPAN